MKKYIIITAAYNEEKNIEKTIKSVISQSLPPIEWLIISDASTDKTDSIVQDYAKRFRYITYIRIDKEKKHNFASKVYALNTAFDTINRNDYQYIGILDADVSFEKTYFEEIINRFENNDKLGIAGGNIVEYVNGSYNRRIKSLKSVAGAVQFMRKECFEQTIGFLPLEYGGEDAVVEISARMNGWEVKTFLDIEVVHHGLVGGNNFFRNRFRRGIQLFLLGYHPLFLYSRNLFRLKERPIIIGSFIEIIGYFLGYLKFRKSSLPIDLIDYLRNEQKQTLKSLLKLSNIMRIKDRISF